jgi:hypothetical protein
LVWAEIPVRLIPQDWDAWRDPAQPAACLAHATNDAIAHATHPVILYLQADEIWTPEGCAELAHWLAAHPPPPEPWGIAVPFIHLRPDLHHEQANPGYTHAVRVLARDPAVRSVGDAWTFAGPDPATWPWHTLQTPIFHIGYIHRDRHVVARRIRHHATTLYPHLPVYTQSANAADHWAADPAAPFWQAIKPFDHRVPYPPALRQWAATLGLI